eukprot:3228854-Rhodomonas_salina.1
MAASFSSLPPHYEATYKHFAKYYVPRLPPTLLSFRTPNALEASHILRACVWQTQMTHTTGRSGFDGGRN